MRMCWILFLSLLSIALAGCGNLRTNVDKPPTGDSATSTEANDLSIPSPVAPKTDDDLPADPSLPIPAITGMEAVIEEAKVDLSQRLSIPVAQINNLESEQVFWPDASLGCPRSGVSYTQVVVPGYRIILESQGSQFEYHANIHGHVIYCENPTPPIQETPATGQP